ncbi:MAG: VOC family protein [Candidatus Baltobacteraceae bacterium]
MPSPVVHFEIATKDPDALTAFFRDAFDWTIAGTHAGTGEGDIPKYIVLRPTGEEEPNIGINGGVGGVPQGYDGHVTFYIAVDDIEAALQKVEQLGGTRIMGPEQVPGGPLIALFSDPQGHTIGLAKPDM